MDTSGWWFELINQPSSRISAWAQKKGFWSGKANKIIKTNTRCGGLRWYNLEWFFLFVQPLEIQKKRKENYTYHDRATLLNGLKSAFSLLSVNDVTLAPLKEKMVADEFDHPSLAYLQSDHRWMEAMYWLNPRGAPAQVMYCGAGEGLGLLSRRWRRCLFNRRAIRNISLSLWVVQGFCRARWTWSNSTEP